MITDSISVYKESWERPIVPYTPHYTHQYNYEREIEIPDAHKHRLHAALSEPTPATTKLYYTEWLKTVPFKRGQYVVSKSRTWPYISVDFYRVMGLQEVHHFVKFDDKGHPVMMELISSLGTRFWTNVVDYKIEMTPRLDCCFDIPAN